MKLPFKFRNGKPEKFSAYIDIVGVYCEHFQGVSPARKVFSVKKIKFLPYIKRYRAIMAV